MRATVLDEDYYDDALEENEIYDRVYTELLADPELAETVDNLLAGIPVEQSLQVAALRLVLPPDRLQEVIEALVDDIVAYLRSERDFLGSDVSIEELLSEIDTQVTALVQEELAELPPETVETVEELGTQIQAFSSSLANGEIPTELPVLGEASLEEQAITAAVIGAIDGAVDPETVDLIEAHVAVGDLAGAVTVAAAEYLDPHLDENESDIRRALEGDDEISLFDLFSEASGRTGEQVLDEFNTVRGIARWFSPVVGYVAVALMLAALAAAIWLARRRGLSPLGGVAGILLATGAVAFVVVGILGFVAEGPLDDAVRGGVDGWGLPVGLRGMLEDLRGTLSSELFEALRTPVTFVLSAGAIAAIATLLLAGRLGDLADPPARRRAFAFAGVLTLAVFFYGSFSVNVTIEGDPPRECNGHEELCDRPYDEVVFAGSHNSMSTSDRSFIWPEHDLGLGDQLDYGVRLLLIDTHYWEGSEEVEAYLGSIPPEFATAARAFLDDRRQDGAFLCHNLCSLGAIALEEALGEVGRFLDDNPNEVVTLFIEDDISDEDTAAAFEAAGLVDETSVHEPGEAWPTLGEMIDSGRRLVVLAEESGPPPAWYQQGFELVQDTPYEFDAIEDFDCAPNRGPADADLFLMNHWLDATAASRAETAEANAHDVLVERARRCEEERGQPVNYVAVNFYSLGDLLEAVDTLNSVESDHETS